MSPGHAMAELLQMLLAQPHLLTLLSLLGLAALIDWRTLRIPNWLTGGGAVLGLGWSVLAPPSAQMGWDMALAGLALGLVLMLPMYLLGVMGAGDVKLMAMAGAYLGLPGTLHAVACVFVTGGLLALLTVAVRDAWRPLWRNLWGLLTVLHVAPEAIVRPGGLRVARPSVGKLPYGVSICVGTVGSVLARQLGYA